MFVPAMFTKWSLTWHRQYHKPSSAGQQLVHPKAHTRPSAVKERIISLYLNKHESLSSKDALCHVWLILTQRFWRKRFLNIFKTFLLFHYYLPLKELFIWTNLISLYTMMLCAKFGWNWPSRSGEEDFKIFWIEIYYFVTISPWSRAWPFIWTNLNPLYPRMLCAKFGKNLPNGFREEDLKYFESKLTISLLPPLEERIDP